MAYLDRCNASCSCFNFSLPSRIRNFIASAPSACRWLSKCLRTSCFNSSARTAVTKATRIKLERSATTATMKLSIAMARTSRLMRSQPRGSYKGSIQNQYIMPQDKILQAWPSHLGAIIPLAKTQRGMSAIVLNRCTTHCYEILNMLSNHAIPCGREQPVKTIKTCGSWLPDQEVFCSWLLGNQICLPFISLFPCFSTFERTALI
jgi:hypothetical protein